MNKVALKKIGFAEQNEIDDAWQQQQTESERSSSVTADGTVWHWFDSVDQNAATLEEELVDDETGSYYSAHVDFTVRTETDMATAKQYANRPLVMKVMTVDDNTYIIGTSQYPVAMTTSNRYSGLNTREVQVRCSYDTLIGIMQ